jgi:hypothetical protein
MISVIMDFSQPGKISYGHAAKNVKQFTISPVKQT